MNHFLYRNPWLWPRGNAEVFFFFLVLSNETFSPSLFSLSVVFVFRNWMQPTGFRRWFPPSLRCTAVTTTQRVLCRAAYVQSWCSLRVLVQDISSCLGPWPPFLSWLCKTLFSRYQREQNAQQNGGKHCRENLFTQGTWTSNQNSLTDFVV